MYIYYIYYYLIILYYYLHGSPAVFNGFEVRAVTRPLNPVDVLGSQEVCHRSMPVAGSLIIKELTQVVGAVDHDSSCLPDHSPSVAMVIMVGGVSSLPKSETSSFSNNPEHALIREQNLLPSPWSPMLVLTPELQSVLNHLLDEDWLVSWLLRKKSLLMAQLTEMLWNFPRETNLFLICLTVQEGLFLMHLSSLVSCHLFIIFFLPLPALIPPTEFGSLPSSSHCFKNLETEDLWHPISQAISAKLII